MQIKQKLINSKFSSISSYPQYAQINKKKPSNFSKHIINGKSKSFTKGERQRANKHMERC